MRALQCQWNFCFKADTSGTTDIGVITKAYVSLFTPPAIPIKDAAIKEPPAATLIVAKASEKKAVYTNSTNRPVFAIREIAQANFTTVPDHHVYLAICRASKLPSAKATGHLSRESSANPDKEFDNYDC